MGQHNEGESPTKVNRDVYVIAIVWYDTMYIVYYIQELNGNIKSSHPIYFILSSLTRKNGI